MVILGFKRLPKKSKPSVPLLPVALLFLGDQVFFVFREVKLWLNNEQLRMILFWGSVDNSKMKRKAETLIFLPAFLCNKSASKFRTRLFNFHVHDPRPILKAISNSPWSNTVRVYNTVGATSPLKSWKNPWYDVLMYYLCMKKISAHMKQWSCFKVIAMQETDLL